MVIINPGQDNLKKLEDLKKQKIEKERELLIKQQQAAQRLQELQEEGETEIKEVEKRLDDAVADMTSGDEGGEVDPGPRREEEEQEEQNLEELAQQKAREAEEGEGGLSYDIQEDEIEKMGDLYGSQEGNVSEFYAQENKQEFYGGHEDQHSRPDDGGDVYQAQAGAIEQMRRASSDGYKS